MAKNLVEAAKKLAAIRCIDEQVVPLLKPNSVIGIGSGSTVVYAVERLIEQVNTKNLTGQIKCVPSSYQAINLINNSNGTLILSDLARTPKIDIGFDGADEVDNKGTLIKGGGGCLTQEKIVASACQKFVIVADYRKNSKFLGNNWKKGIPIEVIPMATELIKSKIEGKYGGEAKLRYGVAKAGPCVTDNSNFILDWVFEEEKLNDFDWEKIDQEFNCMAGVVETGIFYDMARCCYFGNEDGSVEFSKF